MVVFVERGGEEEEEIIRVKEGDFDVRDIDVICWIFRKKGIMKSWFYKLEFEVDGRIWRFGFEDSCI